MPGGGVGEQSPPGAVGGEFPCHLGGDGSVPGQFRAVLGQTHEHGGGHGDLHQHPVVPPAILPLAPAAAADAAAAGAAVGAVGAAAVGVGGVGGGGVEDEVGEGVGAALG